MNINHLYHPDYNEEVGVHWNHENMGELNYPEWCELMEKVEDGTVSYATWYQDAEETNDELMVLIHEYTIQGGEVKSYNQELTD